MESEKIESINFSIWDFIYIRNGRSRRGLQTRHWQNLGSYGKRQIFGPKTEFLGPKKHPLLSSNHVLATTGKNCANKEVRFFPNKYHFLADFVFFGKKRIFGQKKHFWAIRKNGHFSVILAGTRPLVIVGHSFDEPDDPMFRWPRSKIKGTYNSNWGLTEKRPSGKPKLFRVSSGYVGLMIPLSRVNPSQKNGGFIGRA